LDAKLPLIIEVGVLTLDILHIALCLPLPYIPLVIYWISIMLE
jgi:hypothetical protein